MRRIQKIHFVGIGGVGMGGIAEVLLSLGYQVTGSDISKSSMSEHLKKQGIQVAYSHIAENVAACDAVVVSSAVPDDNIELETARKRRIPIVPRAEMLAELMRFKQGIAVAGTHGKTTTTSLIATIFAAAEMDPTFVIGGKLNHYDVNAKLGQGKYFIAEADESDGSFLNLNPTMSVVTNIDNDHLCAYDQSFDSLKKAFIEFIQRLPFYGLAILCIDDPQIRSMLPEITKPYLTYGASADADIRVVDYLSLGKKSVFSVKLPGCAQSIEITLNLPGKHNILNALAAIAVAIEADIPIAQIQKGLSQFQGVGRRLQQLGNYDLPSNKTITLLDDYGHHPKELKAVIESIKLGWPQRRLVMIYQPHRFSRTQALFEDFTAELSEVDVLILLDVYTAGEAPIVGADSRTLAGSIRNRGKVDPIFISDKAQVLPTLESIIEDNDVILTQGAGDISHLTQQLKNYFTTQQEKESMILETVL